MAEQTISTFERHLKAEAEPFRPAIEFLQDEIEVLRKDLRYWLANYPEAAVYRPEDEAMGIRPRWTGDGAFRCRRHEGAEAVIVFTADDLSAMKDLPTEASARIEEIWNAVHGWWWGIHDANMRERELSAAQALLEEPGRARFRRAA